MANREVAIKRQATSKVDQEIPHKISKTEYYLNIEKSLLKKHLSYKRTHGGIVGIADTATYELLKSAAIIYYKNYPSEKGNANYTCIMDKTGKNEVQTTVRVELSNSDTYTINFYNTTCKMLINGNNVDRFLYNDLGSIHKIVSTCKFNGQEVNLKKINEIFTIELKQIVEKLKTKVQTNTESVPQAKMSVKSIDEGENIQCIGCKKNCRKNASYCTTGKHWVHYRCEKLNDKQIKETEDTSTQEYCCKFCMPDLNSERPNHVLALPNIVHDHSEKDCSAQAILDEEGDTSTMCNVCCIQVENGNGEVCSVCNHLCHIECMEDAEDIAVCCLCKAADEQNEFQQDLDCIKNSETEIIHVHEQTEQVDVQMNTKIIQNKTRVNITNNPEININKADKSTEMQSKGDETIQYLTSEMRQKHLRLKNLSRT